MSVCGRRRQLGCLLMRSTFCLLASFSLVSLGVSLGPASAVGAQEPENALSKNLGADHLGVAAKKLSRASSLDEGNGALIISIRSEIYLDEPIDLFFLREGGDLNNEDDVIRLSRSQSPLAFTNSTVRYKLRSYQLEAGTYRLIAHGMECPKIPGEDERCLADINDLLLGEMTLGRPSRGYPEEAPRFEIRAGQVTIAGDFALTSRNTVEWSEIPADELGKATRRFKSLGRGPEPTIPEDFVREFGLFPRSFETDAFRRY